MPERSRVRARARVTCTYTSTILFLVACSAPARLPGLVVAEHRADSGDIDGALIAYRDAQKKCGRLSPPRHARAVCGEALLGEGEVLERGHRVDAAIAVYLAIPARAGDDTTTASTALFRAGDLMLHAGKTIPAWTALWRVVTDYPDE